MTAGAREHLIQFHRAVTTRDGYGEEVQTWGLLGEEWASIRWGNGSERREAASTSAPQSATFIVLNNGMTRAVNVRDRLYYDGSVWNIGGIAEMRRGELEITAVRDASAVDPVEATVEELTLGISDGIEVVGGDIRLDLENLTRAP